MCWPLALTLLVSLSSTRPHASPEANPRLNSIYAFGLLRIALLGSYHSSKRLTVVFEVDNLQTHVFDLVRGIDLDFSLLFALCTKAWQLQGTYSSPCGI